MLKSVIIVLLLSVSQIYANEYGIVGHGCTTDSFAVRKICTLYRDDLLKCVPDPTDPSQGPDSGVYRVFEKCSFCCDINTGEDAFCTKTQDECEKLNVSVNPIDTEGHDVQIS